MLDNYQYVCYNGPTILFLLSENRNKNLVFKIVSAPYGQTFIRLIYGEYNAKAAETYKGNLLSKSKSLQ